MPNHRGEHSEDQIVEAAIRVLARQGFARTSLLDIAKEAGLSKGALHHHFPSKEALVAAVLERALDRVAHRTLEVWARESGDPIQGLRSAVRELWHIRRDRTDEVVVVADLLAQSLYDSSLRPPIAAYFRFAAQQVVQTLLPHLQSKGFRLLVPGEFVPRLLVALLDGLAMQHYVDPQSIDEDELLNAVEKMARSLLARAERE